MVWFAQLLEIWRIIGDNADTVIYHGGLSRAADHAWTILLGARSVEQWHWANDTVRMQVVADDSGDSDSDNSDSENSDSGDSDSGDSDSDYFTEMTGSRTAAVQPATTWVDSSLERGSRMPGTELETIEEMVTDDEGEVGPANTPLDERLARALALKAAAEANPAHPMCRLCSFDLAVEDARGLGMDLKCKICQKNIDSHECHHCAMCRCVFCSSCHMSEEERRRTGYLARRWGRRKKFLGARAWEDLDIDRMLDAEWKRMASSKTLIELAVADGNLPMLMSLLKGDLRPTHKLDSRLHPRAVHLAAMNGHFDIICLLIEKGADVTAEDEEKRTPVHLAAENGHLEVVRLLIEKGADVTAEDNYKRTPVHLAATNGHLEVVCFLIEKGADVTAQDKEKRTPVHFGSYEWPLGGRSPSDWERGWHHR